MFALFVASFYRDEEIMFGGKEGGSRAAGDPNLVIDMLYMVVYGLLRDDKLTSDLLFGVTTRDQTQDFNLALGETCYQFLTHPADRVACSREYAICCLTIESSCSYFAAQLFRSNFGRQGWAMRAWFGHGMIDIGSGKNPGGGREHRSLHSTIVA